MTAKKWGAAAALGLLISLTAWGADKAEAAGVDPTTLKLIKLLVEQGVLTQEKADALLREASKPEEPTHAEKPKSDANVIRVPYVPETVKQEMQEQIKQEVLAQAKKERWGEPGALPEWIDRIKWDGDIRLRLEKDFFPTGNSGQTPDYQAINNAGSITNAGADAFVNDSVDRERFRLRARLGMLAKVNDEVEAGFRLTTGNTTDPLSPNQTLGNTFTRNSFVLDRAYLRYDPEEWLTVWGGRIPSPWFSTDLVWNENLNFDGIAAQFKPELTDRLTGFATVGWFPVQEVELSTGDKYMTGAQAGIDWKFAADHKLKAALAYYDFHHVQGQRNTSDSTVLDYTAPQFVQKGNSMFDIANDGGATNLFALAAEYKELNLTASWDMSVFDPVHVVLTGDFVKNVGFDRQEILQRTGLDIEPKTRGYHLKLAVGTPVMNKHGDWQFIMAYKYLERDAVLDAFTDSDFHLGGTDAKGWIMGGSYGLARDTWLTLRWMSADQIDGQPPPGSTFGYGPLAIDVLQVDLNAKF
jgi:hypothetical protein